MIIKYLKISEQSDYEDSGCIEIKATNPNGAFQIGMIFNEFCNQNYEVVTDFISDENSCMIRIPLKFRDMDD